MKSRVGGRGYARLARVLVLATALPLGSHLFFDGREAHGASPLIIDQPASGKRPIELNLHLANYYGFGYISYGTAFGLGTFAVGPGFDMLFPVVHNGFIPKLNNAFYVGFFADSQFHLGGFYSFLSLAFGPYVQWRFYLLRMFNSGALSVFANFGGGVWMFFPNTFDHCPSCNAVYVNGFPLFQVGGNLFFTRNVGLRLLFGYPSASVGVSFAF